MNIKKNTIYSIIVVGVVTPDVVIRYKRLLFPGTTLRPGKSHLEIKKKPCLHNGQNGGLPISSLFASFQWSDRVQHTNFVTF